MMKMNRFLAVTLSLCMVLTMLPLGVLAHEGAEKLALDVEHLSGVSVDLAANTINESELALVKEHVDANGMIDVFIVMEGESIIESDAAAVVNDETEAQAAALVENQEAVIAEIEETVLKGETLEIDYNYTWLFNGVAAQIPYEAMGAIAALDGVAKVVVQPVYEICESTVTPADVSTMTISDGVMVGRENTWAAGYTGKGIKIAVIDTGLDTDHQNFAALSEEVLTASSATAESVASVLDSLNASTRYEGLTIDDVYYSTKVAFGFNYSDDNLDITHANDDQGDHGTHVAGIAAANKVAECGVVGVAPDAQLYILKVFGGQRAGNGSDIIAALEDALILGADVVNMSLGSNAGFPTSTSDFVNSIYARVAETNTVLSISAGNSYTAGYENMWGTNANLTSNPDNAVIGQPGIYQNVMSVASVENWKIQRNYIQVSDGYQMGFTETSTSYGLPSVLTLEGQYSVVPVPGYGEPADYEGLDVAGKIALVQRGSISFPEKVQYAWEAGAVACLVYNNTSGEIYMNLEGCPADIPAAAILMADGEYLIAAGSVTVSFPADTAAIPSLDAYQMSDFSSWGVAPDLSLEPDITAPGGNIYSTIDDGQYGLMSGTSMAAPNVAGMSALVMQYARENFEGEDYRTLVQNLLMSTSAPLTFKDEDLFYSPRNQGSGLANAFNAITTDVYLTVDGCEMPKIELGQDAAKTGSYNYTFNVTNFGDTAAYYALNTVAQSEGVLAYGDIYFMSSTPVGLGAATAETSGALVLTHDVDGNAVTDSRDAYLIYQAAMGNGETSFRYDVNGDDAVAADDVQAYLDALVGNDSAADLTAEVLEVAAGATISVDVSVALADDDKAYLDTYYPNGGYVEGYTFLTALSEGDVDLSLPYLAFYGNWDDAPIFDDGNYWDLANGIEGGNQYYNILWTNFQGMASQIYPGYNVYVEEAFDIDHISVSPDGNGYFDTVDDIYTSLLRNAAELTYRYTNMETGEVYYEQTALNVSKTVYQPSYGQIVPNIYSWYEGEIALWDWKETNGNDLANNTKLLLEIEALGAYEGATPETWSVPITVDLEAPTLLGATRITDAEGNVTLELTFKDNLSVSVVSLMNGDGSSIYYMEPVTDVTPDADGYQTYTASFDITNITGKIMIVLGDYALNESYFGINAGGEGAAYDELIGYRYSVTGGENGWVSFGEGVNADENMMFMDYNGIVAAEYVGGYVFAQTETGALYGFRYADMLKDSFDLESTYIAQLDNVYQDLAYSYAEGKLYGLYTYADADGYPTAEVYSINLKGAYYDEDLWMDVAPYEEVWTLNRGGLYGLTMAIDDAGTIYVLGPTYDWDAEALTETAHIWSVGMEYDSWSDSYMLGYSLSDLGDTGLSMDYLQSMTWDHNAEKMYWARFDAVGTQTVQELYTIDVAIDENDDETSGEDPTYIITCTKVGTLSGEICALFAPLTEDSAAKDAHQNLPAMDPSVPGTPILRDELVTMNVTGTKTLAYDLDPWYTDLKDVVWSSSDETVVSVDQNGTINCLKAGSAVITVANAADESKCDTVNVEVTALNLSIEGIVSAQGAGLGNASGVSTYKYDMVDGIAAFSTVNQITAPAELNYGLDLSTSVMARGYLWACEYGNTGMIYQIDPATGVVVDVLEPMDGDMLFGMTYSEQKDTFSAIMNQYLYVDLKLTHEEQEDIMNSYDESANAFMYHKINMLPYLEESNTGFVTGETGKGASTEIVFSAITTIEGGESQSLSMDYMGGYGPEITYTPDQTLVLMDNVGRLWFVDEVTGMTVAEESEWGTTYMSADGMSMISTELHGVEAVADDNGTYSVFVIRKLSETPLTNMFRQGTMPRITYHFSDIEYAGTTADGAPMIVMSLYDYWNNGTTNELYLYVAGAGTGEYGYDENWNYVELMTPDRLYNLGNTGAYNIIASVHSAAVTGGVDPEIGEVETPSESVEELIVNAFRKASATK